MQKILIVSSKNLLSQPFEGAQKRILDISKFLSKKNKVDLVCVGENVENKQIHLKHFNNFRIFKISFIIKLANVFFSILKLQPLQNGYFFSKEMFNYINENKDNYDYIIFHLIRSAQYLPNEYRGKTILEMTDLISVNYKQIIKNTSLLNPVKYLYLLEYALLKNYEKKISNLFDKVIFITKKELEISKTFIDRNKISVISNKFNFHSKIFKHDKKNYKILFVGNINYLPNKIACYNFAKTIMPILRSKHGNLEFNIVGKINFFDKLILSTFLKTKIHGPIENVEKIVRKSICGICNLKVATGLQMKIFTYMGFGLPSIIHKNSFPKNILKKNKHVLVYSNDKELISLITNVIKNKKIANKISLNSIQIIKNKFNSVKIFNDYLKIF